MYDEKVPLCVARAIWPVNRTQAFSKLYEMSLSVQGGTSLLLVIPLIIRGVCRLALKNRAKMGIMVQPIVSKPSAIGRTAGDIQYFVLGVLDQDYGLRY